MEQVSCKHCKTLFIPRKYKNGAQKFCKNDCYFKHARSDQEPKQEPVIPAACDNREEAIVFCALYFLVAISGAFALFVYWTY